ncbi:hypothetical protein BC835DRAFT_1520649 [Cytidiella melzeri]|nr:hypothetical protein BC835DRAFT_1520649 [Cytidiella melzeri]
MRLSSTLVLFVAIVTVSALPYSKDRSGNPPPAIPEELSTGQHPILHRSVSTTPLQPDSGSLLLDSQPDSKLNKQGLHHQEAFVRNDAGVLQLRAYAENEAGVSEVVPEDVVGGNLAYNNGDESAEKWKRADNSNKPAIPPTSGPSNQHNSPSHVRPPSFPEPMVWVPPKWGTNKEGYKSLADHLRELAKSKTKLR